MKMSSADKNMEQWERLQLLLGSKIGMIPLEKLHLFCEEDNNFIPQTRKTTPN
jgi:hypothetical protein